jgi:putative peptide zinc metalloprotease protein
LEEIEARLRQALQDATPNLKPLNAAKEATAARLRRVETDKAALIVRARHDGTWVAPNVADSLGRWITRGTPLGVVVNPSSFEFLAPVAQTDGDALFGSRLLGAELRLVGQGGASVPVERWIVVPGEQQHLPSAALGWAAGGEVPVVPSDSKGQKTVEPFFEVRAEVGSLPGVALLHGRSGKIRFDLAPEPLLPRWIRRLRQLLQQRYQA